MGAGIAAVYLDNVNWWQNNRIIVWSFQSNESLDIVPSRFPTSVSKSQSQPIQWSTVSHRHSKPETYWRMALNKPHEEEIFFTFRQSIHKVQVDWLLWQSFVFRCTDRTESNHHCKNARTVQARIIRESSQPQKSSRTCGHPPWRSHGQIEQQTKRRNEKQWPETLKNRILKGAEE
jgi:hypothetical protein